MFNLYKCGDKQLLHNNSIGRVRKVKLSVPGGLKVVVLYNNSNNTDSRVRKVRPSEPRVHNVGLKGTILIGYHNINYRNCPEDNN